LTPSDHHTRLIALMNQKGGVGKTTTTLNLGAALAEQGRSVLLVDLDPQAHLTLHVGVNPDELEASIYDVITDDGVSVFDVAQQVDERLAVLPADVSLAGAEAELAPKMVTGQAQRTLRSKCEPFLQQRAFDFVLIDCPPSLGLLTINGLVLAEEVIVPMQAHFLAMQGLSKLLETIQFIRQSFNPKLSASGVVLCMHEKQTILAQEVVDEVNAFLDEARGSDLPWANALVYEPPVRRNIKLAEAPSFGQSIIQYAPDSNGADDYRRLARSVLDQNAAAKVQADLAAKQQSATPPPGQGDEDEAAAGEQEPAVASSAGATPPPPPPGVGRDASAM